MTGIARSRLNYDFMTILYGFIQSFHRDRDRAIPAQLRRLTIRSGSWAASSHVTGIARSRLNYDQRWGHQALGQTQPRGDRDRAIPAQLRPCLLEELK